VLLGVGWNFLYVGGMKLDTSGNRDGAEARGVIPFACDEVALPPKCPRP
jgi:hypothetical protein